MEEIVGCFAFFLTLMYMSSYVCVQVTRPPCAVGWSLICDCDISGLYLLFVQISSIAIVGTAPEVFYSI